MRKNLGWANKVFVFFAGAAVGAVGVFSQLEHYPDGSFRWRGTSRPGQYRTTPAIVAAADLPAGTVLTDESLGQRSLPEELVASGVLRPEQAKSAWGRAVREKVEAGRPLRAALLVEPGSVEDVCDQLVEASDAHRDAAAWAKLEVLRARFGVPGRPTSGDAP